MSRLGHSKTHTGIDSYLGTSMTATKRLLAPLFALLIVVSVIGLLACEDEDVGIPCQMTQTLDAGTSSAQTVSPARRSGRSQARR